MNDAFRDRWGYPAPLWLISLREQLDVLGMWPANERSLHCVPASPAAGSASVLALCSVSSSEKSWLGRIVLNCSTAQDLTQKLLTRPGWSSAPKRVVCQGPGRKAQVTDRLLFKLLFYFSCCWWWCCWKMGFCSYTVSWLQFLLSLLLQIPPSSTSSSSSSLYSSQFLLPLLLPLPLPSTPPITPLSTPPYFSSFYSSLFLLFLLLPISPYLFSHQDPSHFCLSLRNKQAS